VKFVSFLSTSPGTYDNVPLATIALFPPTILKEARSMTKFINYLAVCVLLLCSASFSSAQTIDPKPVQITVEFLYPPSPFLQSGVQHLVYEIRLTNYSFMPYTLDSIDVKAGDNTGTFSGEKLKGLIRLLGDKTGHTPNQTLEGGRSFVVFLRVDFDLASEIPNVLQHTLHFTAEDKSQHIVSAELKVRQNAPIVVRAPLSGPDWFAWGANGDNAPHRRALMVEGGHAWLAQRYAIDFVQFHMVNGKGETWKGPEDQNSSYYCYAQPIHSAAAGKVIEVMDGLPENVPHSNKFAIDLTWQNAGGNHVVVDIGFGLYAFYAHMKPGSIAVKAGDVVTAGQVLGHVGNTGSSTEPHLHFHIIDRPNFLSGQGVPYEFENFSTSGQIDAHEDEKSGAVTFSTIGPMKTMQNEYPPQNAVLVFP
jgi:Peptidase family M23